MPDIQQLHEQKNPLKTMGRGLAHQEQEKVFLLDHARLPGHKAILPCPGWALAPLGITGLSFSRGNKVESRASAIHMIFLLLARPGAEGFMWELPSAFSLPRGRQTAHHTWMGNIQFAESPAHRSGRLEPGFAGSWQARTSLCCRITGRVLYKPEKGGSFIQKERL